MHLIRATFVDHDEARLAIDELRDELGVTDVDVAPLAEVDPPLADPLLVATHVPDEDEPLVRGVLRSHGAAVVSRSEDPVEPDLDGPIVSDDHRPVGPSGFDIA